MFTHVSSLMSLDSLPEKPLFFPLLPKARPTFALRARANWIYSVTLSCICLMPLTVLLSVLIDSGSEKKHA